MVRKCKSKNPLATLITVLALAGMVSSLSACSKKSKRAPVKTQEQTEPAAQRTQDEAPGADEQQAETDGTAVDQEGTNKGDDKRDQVANDEPEMIGRGPEIIREIDPPAKNQKKQPQTVKPAETQTPAPKVEPKVVNKVEKVKPTPKQAQTKPKQIEGRRYVRVRYMNELDSRSYDLVASYILKGGFVTDRYGDPVRDGDRRCVVASSGKITRALVSACGYEFEIEDGQQVALYTNGLLEVSSRDFMSTKVIRDIVESESCNLNLTGYCLVVENGQAAQVGVLPSANGDVIIRGPVFDDRWVQELGDVSRGEARIYSQAASKSELMAALSEFESDGRQQNVESEESARSQFEQRREVEVVEKSMPVNTAVVEKSKVKKKQWAPVEDYSTEASRRTIDRIRRKQEAQKKYDELWDDCSDDDVCD